MGGGVTLGFVIAFYNRSAIINRGIWAWPDVRGCLCIMGLESANRGFLIIPGAAEWER